MAALAAGGGRSPSHGPRAGPLRRHGAHPRPPKAGARPGVLTVRVRPGSRSLAPTALVRGLSRIGGSRPRRSPQRKPVSGNPGLAGGRGLLREHRQPYRPAAPRPPTSDPRGGGGPSWAAAAGGAPRPGSRQCVMGPRRAEGPQLPARRRRPFIAARRRPLCVPPRGPRPPPRGAAAREEARAPPPAPSSNRQTSTNSAN